MRALAFCDLDCSSYKSLSFRIGAASLAAENGMSDAQIRGLGRWTNKVCFFGYCSHGLVNVYHD